MPKFYKCDVKEVVTQNGDSCGKCNNCTKEYIGKANNQNFVNVPFKMLIDQIEYKAQEYGIKVVKTEESYTSKASFLDNDDIPNYKKDDDNNHKFSGNRRKRGLYITEDGTKINADVNGAYNIMRKVYSDKINSKNCKLHPKIINLK